MVARNVLRNKTYDDGLPLEELPWKTTALRCALISLVIGGYDGFYGPGTGTFLLLAFTAVCGFDLVTANIVAEIIIRMAPDLPNFLKKDAVLIVSGIVDSKQADTAAALKQNGFEVIDELHENEWCAMALKVK